MSREQVKGKMGNREEMDKMRDNFSSIQLTEDEIKEYGDSEYVKSYYYTALLSVNGKSITKVSLETGNRFKLDKDSTGDFSLMGYDSYESMQEFINGDYTIVDGEVSSDFSSNQCLINEELATSNNLSVGDTITLVSASDENKSYDFIVSGIYADNEDSSNDRMNMFSNSANTIITNINSVLNIGGNITFSPTYKLTSTEVVDKFSSEVKEKGLNEYLEVQNNLGEVESKIRPISNIKTFVSTFLIITLLVGGVVLCVINMINIRERKYEIGVLRTIGMSKLKLSLQFISEVMIVAFCSILLGLGVGAVCSVSVSNHLLQSEIESSEENRKNIEHNFGMKDTSIEDSSKKDDIQEQKENMNFGNPQVNEITKINAAVDMKVIIELIVIGLLLTLISSFVSMVSIQRFSPLTILKERS